MSEKELIKIGENWYQRTRKLAEAQLNPDKSIEYKVRAMFLYREMMRRVVNVSTQLGWVRQVNYKGFKDGGFVPKSNEQFIVPRYREIKL